MENSLPVPEPDPSEQVRLLAAAFSDLQTVVGLIVEKRGELLPGEAADELVSAWAESRESFEELKEELLRVAGLRSGPPSRSKSPIKLNMDSLKEHQLIGPVGTAKRSFLSRLRDRFYSYWNSLPLTDDKKTKAGEAAVDWFEFASSVAGSIPYAGKVEELLLLIKQLVSLRLRRGY